jgi:hypothetical protein
MRSPSLQKQGQRRQSRLLFVCLAGGRPPPQTSIASVDRKEKRKDNETLGKPAYFYVRAPLAAMRR